MLFMDILLIVGILLLSFLWIGQVTLAKIAAKKDMNAYYKSDEWAHMRRKAYGIHGRKCAVCNTDQNLQVHHLRYRKWFAPIFGRENPKKDLMILCRKHHIRGSYSRSLIRLRRLYLRMFNL